MTDRPTYGKWAYHIARKWKAPPTVNGRKVDVPKIIGFAHILASFATDGENIWPAVPRLAKLANCDERTARRLRQDCIALGLFKVVGKTVYNVPKLELSIPPDDGDHGDNCQCSPACVRRYLAARVPKGGKLITFPRRQSDSSP